MSSLRTDEAVTGPNETVTLPRKPAELRLLLNLSALAGALAFFPQRAGSASSLLGAMHYGSGIFSAALVSWLSDGTPKGMALVMGGAAIGCLVVALISKSTRVPQSAFE